MFISKIVHSWQLSRFLKSHRYGAECILIIDGRSFDWIIETNKNCERKRNIKLSQQFSYRISLSHVWISCNESHEGLILLHEDKTSYLNWVFLFENCKWEKLFRLKIRFYFFWKWLSWTFLTKNNLLRPPCSFKGFWLAYGASFVPCKTNDQSKKCPLVRFSSSSKRISNVQTPWAGSAQWCVVMNGQRWKPFLESSSKGLRLRINDFVPDGDVKNITIFPRRLLFTVMKAWTCSR